MYYAIAIIAYVLTVDCVQGGTLAQDMGITVEDATNRMCDLFKQIKENK